MGLTKGAVKAADRTIDIFTGKTKEETIFAAQEDLQDVHREPFTGIEGESDRWRDSAFTGQQWTTDVFYNGDAKANQLACSNSGYRMTKRGGWIYLERIANPGNASSYAGVMFPEVDLDKLAGAFVGFLWKKSKEETKKLFTELCK